VNPFSFCHSARLNLLFMLGHCEFQPCLCSTLAQQGLHQYGVTCFNVQAALGHFKRSFDGERHAAPAEFHGVFRVRVHACDALGLWDAVVQQL
jgi:hypothetical protein